MRLRYFRYKRDVHLPALLETWIGASAPFLNWTTYQNPIQLPSSLTYSIDDAVTKNLVSHVLGSTVKRISFVLMTIVSRMFPFYTLGDKDAFSDFQRIRN